MCDNTVPTDPNHMVERSPRKLYMPTDFSHFHSKIH